MAPGRRTRNRGHGHGLASWYMRVRPFSKRAIYRERQADPRGVERTSPAAVRLVADHLARRGPPRCPWSAAPSPGEGAGMKFNDGYWLLREGVTARYAGEAFDVRTEPDGASIAVLTRRVENRGSVLNAPTI